MMRPFYEITNKEEDIPLVLIKFDCFPDNVLIIDRYCTSPFCSCTEILLDFIRVVKGKAEERLCLVHMDITTRKITKTEFCSRENGVDAMPAEFEKGITDELYVNMVARMVQAKAYGREHPEDHITPEMLSERTCYNYDEIYGHTDEEVFRFKYEGYQYAVTEAYCLIPSCHCNDVVLQFIKINPVKEIQDVECAVRLSLKDYQYTIEHNQCSQEKVHAIVTYFLEHKKAELSVLKRHYHEMKTAGKRIMEKGKAGKQQNQLPETSKSVGRNDLCPCGSGKKYKKCCLK